MWRDDAYLLDMLIAARRALRYTTRTSRQDFDRDEQQQDAVMRMIQIVGEAATKISPEFRESHPMIPWREVIGMRHRLVHDYFHIDIDRVWEVIDGDLPKLISIIETLIPPDDAKTV
jgi:uncharacterized protein with HEPN domain